jgi:hypothetical protein
MKTKMTRQFFVKFPSVKLYENPFRRNRRDTTVAYRQTDGLMENILVGSPQGCKRA